MKVEIDDRSGFCFGVVQAIAAAEDAIAGGKQVWSLGDIVHNRVEVQRLGGLGLTPLRHEDFDTLRGSTVLIRAHGEPPSTYEKAAERGITLIDATCPVVARLQGIVKEAHAAMKKVGGQVVILGKKGHAEVVGLSGQVGGDVTIIEGVGDLDALDFSRPIYLLSQTTQSLALFGDIIRVITDHAPDLGKVTVNDTICRQVSNREQHLGEFATRHDVVVFVSGRKSSNGRVLFEVCRAANPQSHLVEDETEVDPAWFAGAESVGVCGATSTPRWLMERVARHIESGSAQE